MDARHKLLDIAAFLDRLERHGQEDDFRVAALYDALKCLNERNSQRAYAVQMLLSDPSAEPIAAAPPSPAAPQQIHPMLRGPGTSEMGGGNPPPGRLV